MTSWYTSLPAGDVPVHVTASDNREALIALVREEEVDPSLRGLAAHDRLQQAPVAASCAHRVHHQDRQIGTHRSQKGGSEIIPLGRVGFEVDHAEVAQGVFRSGTHPRCD